MDHWSLFYSDALYVRLTLDTWQSLNWQCADNCWVVINNWFQWYCHWYLNKVMQQKALECWNVLLTFNETRAAVQKTFWQTEESIYCKAIKKNILIKNLLTFRLLTTENLAKLNVFILGLTQQTEQESAASREEWRKCCRFRPIWTKS